jgi:hypothetical protein
MIGRAGSTPQPEVSYVVYITMHQALMAIPDSPPCIRNRRVISISSDNHNLIPFVLLMLS